MTLNKYIQTPPLMRAILATALLLLAYCMLSCSPAHRLEKLLNKHPELLSKDSIHTVDTIVRPGAITETKGIMPVSTRDTITIHDTIKHTTIKYIRMPGDSIFIQAECPADTTFIDRVKYIEKYRDREPWYKEILNGIPWWLIVIVILSLVGWILSKFLK